MSETTASVILKRRPRGAPVPDDFDLVEEPLGTPGAGEILLKNHFVSLDAGFRNWMDEDSGDDVLPAMALGAPVAGLVLGRVERSNHADFDVGTWLMARLAWQEHTITAADDFLVRVPEPMEAAPEHYLGILGDTGLSAYFGLTEVAAVRPGDTVLVSAAGGAVGSIAGQVARLLGATRVVGIAGGRAKCDRIVRDLGYDACVDRYEPVDAQLGHACPDGVDVYFDNVGGPLLEQVIEHLNLRARVALCGSVATYGQPQAGPSNLFQLVTKEVSMTGFMTHFRADAYPAARSQLAKWLAAGDIVAPDHRLRGIGRVAEAFCDLFAGRNFGKTLVEL